jgi:hypothetical protein
MQTAHDTTLAHVFAALFGDDGQCFETADGIGFSRIASDMNAAVEYGIRAYDDNDQLVYEVGHRSGWFSGDPVRYVFPDGSAVVEQGGAWDIEGATPFSWESGS